LSTVNCPLSKVASALLEETERKLAELVGVRVRLRFEVLVDVQVGPEEIIQCVSGATQVPAGAILGSSRVQRIAYARHIVAYMLRYRLGLSWKAIGRTLNRDHTTAINSVRVVQNELAYNKELAGLLEKCTKAYKEMMDVWTVVN